MPARDHVIIATFQGVRKGRPMFDFGDTAPPDWLLKLAESGKVVGEQFIVAGKPLEPGQEVRKP